MTMKVYKQQGRNWFGAFKTEPTSRKWVRVSEEIEREILELFDTCEISNKWELLTLDEDWKIEESDKGAEFFAYQKMTPNEYIKQVTGKLIIETDTDIEELVKAYKPTREGIGGYNDKIRVRKALMECIKLNNGEGE